MKLYRNAVILIVVVALLGAAYFFLGGKSGEPAQETQEDKSIKLLETQADRVSEVTIENGQDRIVLVRKDKEMVVTEPQGLNPDKNKLTGMENAAALIKGEKVVEENASDLAKYGLDKPVVITIKLGDGAVKVFEVGSRTPTKEAYYMKEKDSSKVYTLPLGTGDTLLVTKNDLRDKKIFYTTSETMDTFTLEKGGKRQYTLKRVMEESKDPKLAAKNNWFSAVPVDGHPADMGNVAPMLDIVVGSTMVKFIEDNATDLSKYGLDSPAYALEATMGGKATKLLIGDEIEKGKVAYAKLADSAEIFTLDITDYTFLDRPFSENIERFVYLEDIDNVSRITIEMDGKTDNLDMETDNENKDNDKFKVNGKNVPKGEIETGKTGDGLFRVCYTSIIGIGLKEVETGLTPKGKPEITFTYSLKKMPGTMKLEFIPRDGKSYYTFKNGTYSGLVVGKEEFDKVRTDLKNLLDVMAKVK